MKILGLICSLIMMIASYSITGPFGFILSILGPLNFTVFVMDIQRDDSIRKLIGQGLAEYEVDPKTGKTQVVWTNKTLPGKPVYLG